MRLDNYYEAVDKVAKGLQEDIDSQRKENEGLRKELIDTQELCFALKQNEEALGKCEREIRALKSGLKQREDYLVVMRRTYGEDIENAKNLQTELSFLRGKEFHGYAKEESLRRELIAVDTNRADLAPRVSEVTATYERNVIRLNEEEENVLAQSVRRHRQLTSATLFQFLKKAVLRRLGLGLGRVKKAGYLTAMINEAIVKLGKLKKKQRMAVVSKRFGRWRSTAIDYMKEVKINSKLIELLKCRKVVSSYFVKWRNEHYRRSKNIDSNLNAAEMLFDVLLRVGQKRLRRGFCTWNKNAEAISKRTYLLKKCIRRKEFSAKKEAVRAMISEAREYLLGAQFRELTKATVETKFKRAAFFHFREAIFAKEDERVVDAQAMLNAAGNKMRGQILVKAVARVLLKNVRKAEVSLMQSAYNALKLNKLGERKAKALSALNHYTAETQKYGEEIKAMEGMQKETKEARVMRALALIFNRRARHYLKKWYNSIITQRENAMRLVKNMLMQQRQKLIDSFHIWRDAAYRIRRGKSMQAKELNALKIQQLLENNQTLDRDLEQHRMYRGRIVLAQLLKAINKVSRKCLRLSLVQWKYTANKARRYELGVKQLEKLKAKHRMSTSIRKLKEVVKLIALENARAYKEDAIRNLVFRHIAVKGFYGLVIHNYRCKYGKEVMRRTVIHLLHRKWGRYLSKWRAYGPSLILGSFKAENDLKAATVSEYTQKIEQAEKEHSNILEEMDRVSKIQRKKVYLSISKILSVKEHINLKTAVNSWQKKVKTKGIFKSLLEKQARKFCKHKLRTSLYKWKDTIFFSNINEIKAKLSKEQAEYNEAMKNSIAKLNTLNKEIYAMGKSINKRLMSTKIKEEQITKGITALKRLKDTDTRQPLRDHYFANWVKFYRRRKDLLNKAKSVIKRYVGKFIYTRLKVVRLIKGRIERASRHLSRLLKLYKKCNVRYFLKSWRHEAEIRTKQRAQTMHEKCNEELAKHTEMCNKIKDSSCENYAKEIIRRRIIRALSNFKREMKLERVLSGKAGELKEKLGAMRVERSFVRWKEYAISSALLSAKYNKAAQWSHKKLQKTVIQRWKTQHYSRVHLPKTLHKVSSRHYLNLLAEALEQMQEFATAAASYKDKCIAQGTSKLLNCLVKAQVKRLNGALNCMKIVTDERALSSGKLKRMLVRCFERRLRGAFDLWARKVEELMLVEDVETRGKSAQEAARTLRNHKSLAEVIQSHRLERKLKEHLKDNEAQSKANPERVSKKHAKPANPKKELSLQAMLKKIRSNQQSNTLRGLIKKWLLSTERAALNMRFVNYWRNWLRRRNSIVATARLVLKRLKNPRLSWALQRLQSVKLAAGREYLQVPRNVLIGRINRDSGMVETLGRENAQIDRLLAQYANLSEKNEWVHSKGKKLAAIALLKHCRAPLHRYLTRWKRAAQELLISRLKVAVDERQRGLGLLVEAGGRLKEKNKALWSECGELRKSSMHGLEIAGIVQEIAREREQMSVDLANRSLTIKKLIEENVSLQEQLDEIQGGAKMSFKP